MEKEAAVEEEESQKFKKEYHLFKENIGTK